MPQKYLLNRLFARGGRGGGARAPSSVRGKRGTLTIDIKEEKEKIKRRKYIRI